MKILKKQTRYNFEMLACRVKSTLVKYNALRITRMRYDREFRKRVRCGAGENGVDAIDTRTRLNYTPLWLCLYRYCLPESSQHSIHPDTQYI